MLIVKEQQLDADFLSVVSQQGSLKEEYEEVLLRMKRVLDEE